METCKCRDILWARIEAVFRLAEDPHLPRRWPPGDLRNAERLWYVLHHYDDLLADAHCPVHGSLQRIYAKEKDR